MEIDRRNLSSKLLDASSSETGSRRPWETVRNTPMTWLLFGVNSFAFFWIAAHHLPRSGVRAADTYGQNWGFATLSGQWWRLLTSLFVHDKVVHLLFNMAGLVLLGRHLERKIGFRYFALLYFGSGLAGGIFLVAFRPDATGYGASLSVLGVLGGLIGFYSSRLIALSNSARSKLVGLVVVAIISVWNDASSIQSGNPGHVIGLLTGVILGLVCANYVAVERRFYSISAAVALILVASAVAARQFNMVPRSLYAAAQALDSGKIDTAVKEIDAVLQVAPNDLSANQIASEIYLKEPDYPRAEKAIRRVLTATSSKDNDYFLYLLGIVELRTNRCAQAGFLKDQLRKLQSKYASALSESPCYIFPTSRQDKEKPLGQTD